MNAFDRYETELLEMSRMQRLSGMLGEEIKQAEIARTGRRDSDILARAAK